VILLSYLMTENDNISNDEIFIWLVSALDVAVRKAKWNGLRLEAVQVIEVR